MTENLMEKVVALCKRRGFFYPGSEVYGGVANTYDYGPMGTELLRNIKNLWWSYFVQQRDDVVGLDASIISHHKIWEASGHVAGFADAMIDCKHCKSRMRADHLLEDELAEKASVENGIPLDHFRKAIKADAELSNEDKELLLKTSETGKVEGLSIVLLNKLIGLLNPKCPNCKEHDWTPVRKFNQLFPVELGLVQGDNNIAYLRGETAQGMFINFKNVLDSTRIKLPFGIAQFGKAFRNEITPGNSIFRTLEFELGEIEYFFDGENTKWETLFDHWQKEMWKFVTVKLEIKEKDLRWREHTDEERSFYSKRTVDLEYQYPFGFKELWGLAYRTDYDLKQHEKFSGKELSYVEPQTGKKIVPHVIEPAVSVNRLMLMVLCNAYVEEEKRVVLKIQPKIAPVKIAVFPLLANKPELIDLAKQIHTDLRKEINGLVMLDDRGNIGKRYLAQDEIGTPWCVTVDFQALEDQTVTIRDRDTAEQIRLPIKELQSYFLQKLV